jgi:hypothetical protein
MSKISICRAATLLWLAIPVASQADTIFSTSGGRLDSGLGFEKFNGVLQEETLGLGERFTPIGNSFFLDLISLPLWLFGGQGAPEITLKIMDDASGQPGQALETFQISGIGGVPREFAVLSVQHPLLVANQPYWVIGFGSRDAFWMGWPTSTVDVLASGPYLDGHWDVIPNPLLALRVEGTPVPEPASGSVFAAGLASLLAASMFRRYRGTLSSKLKRSTSPSIL